ncbi:MAG: TonB-dependent receptor plug domain-containing protein [Flavobacteriaceae bacterium]|nr:TonB-dependent receptor plug domain-containing protein [Flavobacteriaceae bacterium]
MIINKQTFFLISICFLYSISTFSQNTGKETKRLSEILSEVEQQHNVTFTYADKTIENIELSPFNIDLPLTEIIHYLKSKTHLSFHILSQTNILISKQLSKIAICGIIIDNDTSKKIEGAHIMVSDSTITTISNKLGYFILDEINENQIIEIHHLAYPTKYLYASEFAKSNTCLTISLSQNIEKLKEVYLNNYLTTGITSNIDNTITINTSKSGILPGLIEPDILHKIQALPGVGSINETISNINIRGGTHDQNLLLWDGIKMYHSGHFFGLISAFNPYITEEVTVIKNGTSPQYSDGVSGTIDIRLFNKIKGKSFGGGGLNSLSTDVFSYVPISKKMGILFSGRRSITDIIKTPTYKQYFKRAFQDTKIKTSINQENNVIQTNSNFNFYDYSFKYLYDFSEQHNIRISFLNIKNHLDYIETINTPPTNNSKTSKLTQQNMALGLQLNNDWNNNFETQLQTYYTKYNINAINYTLSTDQRLLQNNEVLEIGIKLNSYYRLSKNIKLLNGYHFYELGITNAEEINVPLFIRRIKNVLRNHSIYSELKYISSNKNTTINSGLRVNYIEKFKLYNLEPRIQVLHKLNSNIAIKIGGEFKSQNTTQTIDLQEDFLGVEKRRWILSDNNLVPIIKSKQTSIGLNYKKNDFFIDLEGFYKKVEGITTSTQGFQNQYQFNKTSGNYVVKGVEILINKKTGIYSTWLSYTYSINNYYFPQLIPNSFPNNLDIRHSLSSGITYTYQKLNLALGALWRTGKPNTNPNELDPISVNGLNGFINYEEPNSVRLPNYFRVDFSSTYTFNINKKIEGLLGVSVLNLLNQKNVLNTYYKINTDETLSPINTISMGLTPDFTFRVSF